MRGERFIPKVLPQARRAASNNKATPSNPIRIKAMLKLLESIEKKTTIDDVSDEDIADQYRNLKVLACRIHSSFVFNHQHLKDLSWHKLGEEHPSLQNKLKLDLEGKAFQSGVDIQYCVEMWAADRLLFEAFRGSKLGDSGEENTGSNSEEGNSVSIPGTENEIAQEEPFS